MIISDVKHGQKQPLLPKRVCFWTFQFLNPASPGAIPSL